MPAHTRHVTFQSPRFETRTPAPHFINPTCFGEDVALWLRSKLPAALEPGAPIQEDYGWGIWTRAGDDPYWIAIGLMEEEAQDARDAGTWLVTAAYDPGLSLVRRLFHCPRADDLDAVCRAIDAALHGETDISDIRWWDAQPFLGPGRPHPAGEAPP